MTKRTRQIAGATRALTPIVLIDTSNDIRASTPPTNASGIASGSSSKKAKISPTKPRQKYPKPDPQNAKGKLVAFMTKYGAYDREAAEKECGITVDQQKTMLRCDGKGSLTNELVKHADTL